MAGQLRDKDINLLPMIQKGGGLYKRAKNMHAALITAGVAALILLVWLVVTITEYAVLNGRVRELEAFLTTEGSDVAAISAGREDMEQMRSRCDALSDMVAAIEAQRGLNEEEYANIYAIAEGKLHISRMRYTGRERTLTLEVTAKGAGELPQFIAAMRKTGLFSELRYEGYTLAGDYAATVVLVLNGGDGVA